MEWLENKFVRYCEAEAVSVQVMLDEETYVPEDKPEIGRILLKKGEVVLEPVTEKSGNLRVQGCVEYQIWYRSGNDGRNACLWGKVPFSEEIPADGQGKGAVMAELEDFSVTTVHTRKFRFNGVVSLTVSKECQEEAKICCGTQGLPGAKEKQKNVRVMHFLGEKTDTLRVRQNLDISNRAENLEEMLFFHMALRSPDFIAMDGKVKVQGDLDVFAVYRCESDMEAVAWTGRTIPFQGEIAFSECRGDVILQAVPRLIHKDIVIARDQDGENRILAVDAVVEVTMKIWDERSVPLLEDVYSPEMDVEVKRELLRIPRLRMKNQARMKVTDTVTLPTGQRMLQSCCCDGFVKVDRLEQKSEGLLAEGVVFYWGLQEMTGKEEGFGPVSGAIPFSYLIDMGKKETGNGRFRVMPRLEQMNLSVVGNQEMECRASVVFDALVWEEVEEAVIREGVINPLSKEKVDAMPRIVGYIVQPQDSLWNIAKKYYTTEEQIRKKNGIAGEVKPGDRLVLLRTSEGLVK